MRLLPGESVRTSSVLLYPCRGSLAGMKNSWRRLVKNEYSQAGKRCAQAPYCAAFWGGGTSAQMLEKIRAFSQNRLPYEYIWIDAGWYGIDSRPTPDEFEGNWSSFNGDWRVSPLTHPDGLAEVSRELHAAGMKLLLWFEPERAAETVPAVREHPEYFLGSGKTRLLNLGNPAAWQYLYDLLCEMIETLSIDCYRQDFNIPPLALWRASDPDGRAGITEIKHITGMYALWDALLLRFPKLIIDNCASGGRRIDIETLRRSIPLWRSDYYCPKNFDPEVAQMHNLTFGGWLPYSGSAVKSFDIYDIRSGYCAAAASMQFYYADNALSEDMERQRRLCEEYLRVRPYFSEDFYPLTEPSPRTDVWAAAQYHRPARGDGLLTVFRRPNSPYVTAKFALQDIERDKIYLLEDLDGGTAELAGNELAGLTLTLPDTRCAKLYIYRQKA